jgi:adenylosuccinate synthase
VGSTGCGMGPAYADKYRRKGTRVDYCGNEVRGCKIVNPTDFFVDSDVILFEGAQGFMLDINWGNYPYITSTHCDTGFIVSTGVSPRSIRNIYGIIKLYSTYVGKLDYQPSDPIFEELAKLGNEVGATTGRARQCNWLNLDEVETAVKVNGVNIVIINKCDIIDQLKVFKVIHCHSEFTFDTLDEMKNYVKNTLRAIPGIDEINFSSSPHCI